MRARVSSVAVAASLGMLVVSTPAFAQGPLTRSGATPAMWTGLYVGGSVVFRSGNADTTFEPHPSPAELNMQQGTMKVSTGGVSFQLFGGFGREMKKLIVGIEGDVFFGPPKGSSVNLHVRRNDGSESQGTQISQERASWMFTARGRVGKLYKDDRMMIYGTGGAAFVSFEYHAYVQFLPVGTIYDTRFNATKVGWTAGGGVEYYLTDRLKVRGEYRFTGFGTESGVADANPPTPPYEIGISWPARLSEIYAGAVWRF